jgi:hypothetical protein
MPQLRLALAYGILLATSSAGALHQPWWWAVIGACSLSLITLLIPRPITLSHTVSYAEPAIVLSNVLSASAVAAFAFVFGYAARLAWGL